MITKNFLSLFLRNLSPKQTVFKNSFWLIIGESSRLFRAITIIYAARILGSSQWGIFAYALALTNFFSIFTDIGINGVLVREVAKNKKFINNYISTSFFIKLPLLLMSMLLIILIIPLFTKITQITSLLKIVVFIFASDVLREFGFSITRALEKMEIEAAVKFLTNMAVGVSSFIFVTIWAKPYFLALGYLVGNLVGFLLILWFLRAYLINILFYFTKTLVPKILSSAWPFAIISLFGAILTNTDILMLGWFKSSYEVGLYSAAQRILQLLYLIPTLVSISAFPLLAKVSSDVNKFTAYFEKFITINFILTFPLWLGGIITAKELIMSFFGHDYLPAVTTFKILLGAIIIIFPMALINNAIFIYDQQKSIIKFIIGGSLLNMFLNLLLIPLYSIEGAGVATTVSILLSNLLIWHKMKEIMPFKILPQLKKILVSVLIMCLVSLLLHYYKANLLLNIFVSASTYGLMLFIFKEEIISELLNFIRLTFKKS